MNEYLEDFRKLQKKDTFRGQQWFGERQRLVNKYSWAVPSEEVINLLAKFEEIYEIGANNGYWAKCIKDANGSVMPIDINPPQDTYTSVVEGYAHEFYDRIRYEPVLMVWPPYDNQMAKNVAEQQPSHICYVGEPRGGCTATDGFFDIVDREYGLVNKIEIPSYEGINDNFYHYIRKI